MGQVGLRGSGQYVGPVGWFQLTPNPFVKRAHFSNPHPLTQPDLHQPALLADF